VKIVIRATNWIGDAVMSLPAIRAVRARWPDAEICLLARPWVAAVYEGERAVSRILPLGGPVGVRGVATRLAAARELRTESFDLAITLPNSFESALILWRAGIPRRIGYARDGRKLLLTDAIPRPKPGEIPKHERFYYLELLRRAGIIDALPAEVEIRLDGRDAASQRGRALLAARGVDSPVIGVSPGAASGGAKRWLPERFAEAAATVARETGAAILIFGSDAERELCGQVAVLCKGLNLAGTLSLREFIDMIAVCNACLCNDSGAMHLAAALGVPSVTVFGPTDETTTGPTGSTARIVRQPVDCAPCLKRECPIDHRCMTRVPSDMVATEVLQTIAAVR
jgi:heptosyltransferase-2